MICLEPRCIWLHCSECHGHWPCPSHPEPKVNVELNKTLRALGCVSPIQDMLPTGSWADQVPELRYTIEDEHSTIFGRYRTRLEAATEYFRLGRPGQLFVVDIFTNQKVVRR